MGQIRHMRPRRYRSLAEQVADEIREGIQRGRWKNPLPGRNRLASELGVNHKTCEAALKILETEGLVVSQGKGRGRKIVGNASTKPNVMRVVILVYERSDLSFGYLVRLLNRLREAGHEASFASKTMRGLGMSVDRIAQFVAATEADAWIVIAGPRDVLNWFSQQPLPAFALYGRFTHTPLASMGVAKVDAMRELIDRLVSLNHERIVMLAREDRRKPRPGFLEQSFLDRLNDHGILTSSYNLPDWGDDPDELERVIKSLFSLTPPTALVISEISVCMAVIQQLGRLRIVPPEDVSLVCTDYSPSLDWCRPEITQFHWDNDPLINRVVKWVHGVSLGKDDRRKNHIKARLSLGGTIGPAPK